MQTRDYSLLLSNIKSLAGVASFTPEEKGQILNFVNRRAEQAYNRSPIWSRYLRVSEKRKLIALSIDGSSNSSLNQFYKVLGNNNQDGNDTLVYQGTTDTTALIFNDNSNWVIGFGTATLNTTTGNYDLTGLTNTIVEQDNVKKDNVFDVETWSDSGVIIEEKNLVPYSETGKKTISEFIRLHRKQAFLDNSAIEYDFFTDADGANIFNQTADSDNFIYVTYKLQLNNGNLFTENSSTATNDGIPSEFFQYIAHSSYSDFLRMDGQHQKALVEEQIADEYLVSQLERIDNISNNNSINKKFSTYVNRQSR